MYTGNIVVHILLLLRVLLAFFEALELIFPEPLYMAFEWIGNKMA